MPAERPNLLAIAAAQQERGALSRKIKDIYTEIFGKTRIPLENRIGQFWNRIKGDPEKLDIGLATAIDAARTATPETRLSAQTTLDALVEKRLPKLIDTLPEDEKAPFCIRAASLLVASSINPNIPMPPQTLTVADYVITKLDRESQVAARMAVSTRGAYFIHRLPTREIRNPMGEGKALVARTKIQPKPDAAAYLDKTNQSLKVTGEEIESQVIDGTFDPENLRLAIAALGFSHAELVTYITPSEHVKNLQAKGARYLYNFVDYFNSYPDGYQDALMLAILAISQASPQTQYELLSLLTHNHRVAYNNGEATSLEPALRNALEANSDDLDAIFSSLFSVSSSYQETNTGFTQLTSLLIQQFASVDRITPREQVALIKRFLAFITKYGIDVTAELNDNELIDLFYGRMALYFDQTPGSLIYLITNDEDGINAGGRVIGIIRDQETHNNNNNNNNNNNEEEDPNANTRSAPTVDTNPQAFDFFKTIPFIGSPSETSNAPQAETNPATPRNNSPEPQHDHHDWHFFDTIDPLFETQLQQTLKKIGIKPNLPDHVIEAFDISLEEIGMDLPKENLARTRTLATRGNNVTLEENPTRSDENNFPRVYVKHDEPRLINGVLSSDIFGTLYLTPKQQIEFFLDKNGYPQGDIDKLYDEGLVSWPQIWQIKYRVTSTIHKLLIASQEELSQKHDSLANRANREIGSDRGSRGNSAGRLAEKVRESQRYFDVADFEWSMQPTDNEDQQKEGTFLSNELDKIDEAACQRAIEEMDKTGQKTKTLWRQLDATGMELARKEAHSKGYRVKKDPKNGYPMFMKSGRRQSIQAIDNAIENGVGLHKVIEITTNEAGLHDIVISRSTFVSERTPAVIQENAA